MILVKPNPRKSWIPWLLYFLSAFSNFNKDFEIRKHQLSIVIRYHATEIIW